MAYNLKLAIRIRDYLNKIPDLKVEEKKMFSGITFMVNGKMCINVSGNNLMCRFNPTLYDELCTKKGFKQMIMRGQVYKGFCYVEQEGFKTKRDFEYWIKICLDYNSIAKKIKKK